MNLEIHCTLADGLPVIAKGEYHHGCPAQTYGPPEACYPEEPSEFHFELFWPGKPKDKKLYRCQKELTAADEERIYLAADEEAREDY